MQFKMKVTPNSVQLSWLSASNGGENSTFVLTINQTLNFTTFTEDDSESRFHLIEISGLQPQQTYDFKVSASNSLGSSDSTKSVRVSTLRTALRSKKMPDIQNAQFNEIREAICFDLEPHFFGSEKLSDLFVKLEMSFNEAGVVNQTSMPKETASQTKTFLVNLSKLKYGQNCVHYSKLIQLDWQLRNASRQLNYRLSSAASSGDSRKKSYVLNSSLGMAQSQSYVTVAAFASKSSQEDLRNAVVSNFGQNFYDFKRLNAINVSLCYKNDSNVCTEKAVVYGKIDVFSLYLVFKKSCPSNGQDHPFWQIVKAILKLDFFFFKI